MQKTKINLEQFNQLKTATKEIYKKIGSIYCPAFEERITISKILEEKIRYAQTRSKIYINANEILK